MGEEEKEPEETSDDADATDPGNGTSEETESDSDATGPGDGDHTSAAEATEGDDYDRPDDAHEGGGAAVSTFGDKAKPLLEGSKVGPDDKSVPMRFLLSAGAFIAILLVCFFGFWALLGGLGIFVGVVVGTALGLGAMKLMADRAAA